MKLTSFTKEGASVWLNPGTIESWEQEADGVTHVYSQNGEGFWEVCESGEEVAKEFNAAMSDTSGQSH